MLFRSLIDIRTTSRALAEGGLRWIFAGDHGLVFAREVEGECLIIAATRAATSEISVDLSVLYGSHRLVQVVGTPISLENNQFAFDTEGAEFLVWRLTV